MLIVGVLAQLVLDRHVVVASRDRVRFQDVHFEIAEGLGLRAWFEFLTTDLQLRTVGEVVEITALEGRGPECFPECRDP